MKEILCSHKIITFIEVLFTWDRVPVIFYVGELTDSVKSILFEKRTVENGEELVAETTGSTM